MMLVGAAALALLPSAAFFSYGLWRYSGRRLPWRDLGLALLWAAFAAIFLWFAVQVLLH